MREILQDMININSAPGWERELSEFIIKKAKPFADEIITDSLGNLTIVKKGKKSSLKKLAFSAHMDSPALIASHIEESGKINVHNLGSINISSLMYRSVSLMSGIKGIAAFSSEKDFSIGQLTVDIGAQNKEQAEQVILPGDVLYPDFPEVSISDEIICAGNLTSKVCCAILLDTLMKTPPTYYDLYFIFTSQSNLGSRGARSVFRAVLPDEIIVLDTTCALGPFYGSSPVERGKGPVVRIKDEGAVYSPEVIKQITSLSNKNSLPIQFEVLEKGANDSIQAKLAGEGSLVGCLCLPVIYRNSAVENIMYKDIDALSELLLLIAKKDE